MKLDPTALAQWIAIGENAVGAGVRVVGIVSNFIAAMKAEGIAKDTAALDAMVADATARLERLEREDAEEETKG